MSTSARSPWVILVAACVVLMVSTGLRNSFGVFFKSVADEFGWERATLSLVVSLNMLVFGFSQPLVGRLVDRWGPRRVLALGALVLGGGFGAASLTRNLLETYLAYGVVAGLGFGATAITVASALITRWFDRNRGLALGIAAAGLSAGQIVVVPLSTGLLGRVGWREGFLVMGLGTAVLLTLVVLPMVQDQPAAAPVPTAGRGRALARHEGAPGAAMRTLPFWQLTAAFFGCGFAITLLSTHFIPFATDVGLSRSEGGRLFGAMGAMSIVGSLTTGWISDRLGRRWLLASVYLLRSLVLLLLVRAQTVTDLWVFAVVFGFTWAAPFPLTSAFIGDLWGKNAIATIFGTMFFIHLVGDAAGAYVGGLVFDRAASYTPVFAVAAVMAMLGGLSVLSIRAGMSEPAIVSREAAAAGR